MDPLVEIPLDQWPLLQDKLKDMWPTNVAGFYTLYLNMKYPNVRKAFQFKVYSPNGDIENGFLATSIKCDSEHDCIIFPKNKNTKQLEEAILNTKKIDWNKKICIDLVTSVILDVLKNYVFPTMKLKSCKTGNVKTFFMDRQTKRFEVSFPSGISTGPVRNEEIKNINDRWPYKHDGSYFYFTTLAENNLAHGLYLDKNLIAWAFINEYNFICHLYCEEEHRRKGYAESLLKYIVNEQLGQGNDVYTYVEESNESSSKLFGKLGFVNIDDGAYIIVRK